jgi:hypothetical protein
LAFNKIGFDSRKAAAERKDIEPETLEWLIRMLDFLIVIVRSRLGMEQVK